MSQRGHQRRPRQFGSRRGWRHRESTVANSYNGPTFIRNSGTLNANVADALPTATDAPR